MQYLLPCKLVARKRNRFLVEFFGETQKEVLEKFDNEYNRDGFIIYIFDRQIGINIIKKNFN